MTEDEAKTSRCCGPKGCGEWRPLAGTLDSAPFCIGAACMAWRWQTMGETLEPKGSHRAQHINERGELVVTITSGIAMGGYCGLAGKIA